MRNSSHTLWIFEKFFRSASSFSVGRSPTCKLYKTQSTAIPISSSWRGIQKAFSTKRTKYVHPELIPIPCGPLRYELLFHSPFIEEAAFLSQRAGFNFHSITGKVLTLIIKRPDAMCFHGVVWVQYKGCWGWPTNGTAMTTKAACAFTDLQQFLNSGDPRC